MRIEGHSIFSVYKLSKTDPLAMNKVEVLILVLQ